MIITVASGKGGTGKTTVSVNLARLAALGGYDVHLCDCDVEEPNAHLFLNPEFSTREEVVLPLPVVDQDKCRHCGKCADICEFNAIAALPHQTIVFNDLCHSCSGCWLVCPEKAIDQGLRKIGIIESAETMGLTYTRGLLDVGQTQVPPVVEAVKKVPTANSLVIRDAPPGATCPTVAALAGSDFVVLVTEPTAFGLHDLKVAVVLTRDMSLPCAVVINRTGSGDDRVERFCAEEGVPLLPGLPFRRDVAEAISRGQLVVEAVPQMEKYFADLLEAVLTRVRKAVA